MAPIWDWELASIGPYPLWSLVPKKIWIHWYWMGTNSAATQVEFCTVQSLSVDNPTRCPVGWRGFSSHLVRSISTCEKTWICGLPLEVKIWLYIYIVCVLKVMWHDKEIGQRSAHMHWKSSSCTFERAEHPPKQRIVGIDRHVQSEVLIA
jgi:hypothetical protein